MRLIPVLSWAVDDAGLEALDARLLPLLAEVAANGSLTAAVARCGVSYRAAWGLLRECESRFGEPLVRLERGRGAGLTAAGARVLAAEDTAQRRVAPLLAGLAVEFGRGAQGIAMAPLTLRLAASHDLVLAELGDPAASPLPDLRFEISFMGSLSALKEFSEGRADMAGFHVPVAGRLQWQRKPFLRWLRARRDRLLHVVDRDQGLILPPGNPAGIRTLRDIARQGLRFVNRQHGSGTRLLIDQLLLAARIAPADIDGYGRDEFTHRAVAATVAAGGADAGFGLRAAAAEHELAFVPLVRERYYLAIRARAVDGDAVRRLTALLQSPAFRRLAQRFPGYHVAGAGEIVGVEVLTDA